MSERSQRVGKQLRTDHIELLEKLQALISDNEKLKERIAALGSEPLKSDVQQESQAAVFDKLRVSEAECLKYKLKIKELEGTAADLEYQVKKATQQRLQAEQSLQLKGKSEMELQRRIKELETQLSQIHTDHQTQQAVLPSAAALRQLNERIAEISEQLTDKSGQLDVQIEENRVMKELLVSSEGKIEALTSQMLAMKTQFETERANLIQQLNAAKESLDKPSKRYKGILAESEEPIRAQTATIATQTETIPTVISTEKLNDSQRTQSSNTSQFEEYIRLQTENRQLKLEITAIRETQRDGSASVGRGSSKKFFDSRSSKKIHPM